MRPLLYVTWKSVPDRSFFPASLTVTVGFFALPLKVKLRAESESVARLREVLAALCEVEGAVLPEDADALFDYEGALPDGLLVEGVSGVAGAVGVVGTSGVLGDSGSSGTGKMSAAAHMVTWSVTSW